MFCSCIFLTPCSRFILSQTPGLSKFHFDVLVFVLEFVKVRYRWVHVHAHEVFETVKLLLAGLLPNLDQFNIEKEEKIKKKRFKKNLIGFAHFELHPGFYLVILKYIKQSLTIL